MKRTLLLLGAAAILCSAQSAPTQLFNGTDLEGWQMVGPGRFVVENGMMKTVGGMGLLYYKGRRFGNETIRVVFKTTGERDNSGVVVRMPDPPPDPWYGVHNGYEVQIDAAGDEWHSTGALYSLSKVTKRAQKPAGEWNTMEIELEGDVTRVRLNGELVNEFKGDQAVPERKQWYEPVRGPRPEYGYIGLQNHDPRTTVYFKEVSASGSQAVSDGDKNRLLSALHATRKQILDAVDGLTPAQLTFKAAPEKWSIAEVVEHLALTEPYLLSYGLQFVKNSLPAPQDSKVTTDQIEAQVRDRSKPAPAPAELRPTGKLNVPAAAAFRDARDKTIQWVKETRDPLRKRYMKSGPNVIEVYQFLYVLPSHAERHLAQINEVKASAGYPKK